MTAPDFEFATAGRIMAGPGRAQELPEVLAGLGSRVLVVTGADPARHGGLVAQLCAASGNTAANRVDCRGSAIISATVSRQVA